MAASNSTNPPYISPSPVGFHITKLETFFQSPHLAPVSESPERRHWATKESANQLQQAFPDTPAAMESLTLMIYNKSRDTDRVCPSCRRWYKYGESEHHYASFEDFLRREPPISSTTMSYAQRTEQDLSGICCQTCGDAMVEGPVEADRTSGMELGRSGAWRMRRTTIAEEAEAGVKIVWELVDSVVE